MGSALATRCREEGLRQAVDQFSFDEEESVRTVQSSTIFYGLTHMVAAELVEPLLMYSKNAES
jgi:hypothetical protein